MGSKIPRESSEKQQGKFDNEVYKQRNQVEQLINRLKQYWRSVTRYNKRVQNYKAFLAIAAILRWL